MTSRYQLLATLIDHHKPETILEIGVGEGNTAELMARAALKHRETVYYLGYDLFEDATAENDALEMNAKRHTPQVEIAERLGRIKDEFPGFNFQLNKGNTRDVTEGIDADFAFIDGGHSVETIEHDYDIARGSKVVVFDDFYGPDSDGVGPDTTKFGANTLVGAIGGIPFGPGDPIRGGGITHLAIFPKEALPPQKLKMKSKNCVEDDSIKANILSALSRDQTYIDQTRIHDIEAVMVSAGPSLKSSIPEIRRWARKKNSRLICVKHSHDVLIEKGIVPWGCMLLDPRDHVQDFIENPHPDVIYFVSSMVHPTTLDRLVERGARVYMYHAAVGAGEAEVIKIANEFRIREQIRVKKAVAPKLANVDSLLAQELMDAIAIPRGSISDKLVAGGTSSAMRGINVLYMIGFRHFRLFSYDSCYETAPATQIIEENGLPKVFEVTVANRKFWTDGELVCQYQDLKQLIEALPDLDIEVFGDGMLQHGFRHIAKLPKIDDLIR